MDKAPTQSFLENAAWTWTRRVTDVHRRWTTELCLQMISRCTYFLYHCEQNMTMQGEHELNLNLLFYIQDSDR